MSGTFDARAITRPDPALWRYYTLVSLFAGPAFPFALLAYRFRYRTLRYRFDDEGVSMSWGRFFKKEVHLTYRRIQDIHVTRNVLHRWLGLAVLSLQTASGAAGAEMKIEGIREAEALRDFLYRKMRGAREEEDDAGAGREPDGADEALRLLRGIRDELRRLAAGFR